MDQKTVSEVLDMLGPTGGFSSLGSGEAKKGVTLQFTDNGKELSVVKSGTAKVILLKTITEVRMGNKLWQAKVKVDSSVCFSLSYGYVVQRQDETRETRKETRKETRQQTSDKNE